MNQKLSLDDITDAIVQDIKLEKKFIKAVVVSFAKILPHLIYSGRIFHIRGFCDFGLYKTQTNKLRLRISPARLTLKKLRGINASVNK